MLTRLKVQNFQSISDVDIELGQYTVVVGRSNSGKSAILRALHTLARNSFIPSYVRTGHSSTHITVQVDDSLAISTIRGKESTYSYVMGDDDPEVYTKCGRAVPEEVDKLLALPLVADEDVFFTNQFELPFLVAGKATRASAVMGTLTNAMLVNSLAQEANRVRLNTKQRITVRQDDLTQLEAQKDEFSDLAVLEQALGRVQKLYKDYTRVGTSYDALLHQLRRVQEVTFIEVPVVPDVAISLVELLETVGKVEKLGRLIYQAESIAWVQVPAYVMLDEQLQNLDNLITRYASLSAMIQLIKNQKEKYIQTLKELEKMDSEIHQVEKHLGTFDVCSECGQVLV